jgi:hypothetical protein
VLQQYRKCILGPSRRTPRAGSAGFFPIIKIVRYRINFSCLRRLAEFPKLGFSSNSDDEV